MSRLIDIMLANMPMPDSEPFPGETLIADGWEYRDLPRMSPEYFERLKETIGDENIRWLTIADYGVSIRGQCLISPVGMGRIREHVAAKKGQS